MLLISLIAAASLSAATLATVNGKNITDTDLNEVISTQADPASVPADAKKRVLEDMVNKELFVLDAKAKGIEKDVDFKKQLENLKEGVLVNTYMKKLFDSIKVSDSDIKKAYDEHKKEFIQPAQVKARHILVKTEKEASEVISKLKGLKGDALVNKFSELAKEKSIDPGSGKQGGELGYFPKDAMVPEFGNAAFALKDGEITTKPVKTQFGYHVILKEASKASKTASLDEVKPMIERNLKLEKFQTQVRAKADELKKKYKVEFK
ncbi:peptidylprolyl isomerase [Campylobacter sp. 19-13652]|uniref:peptidylprolyl isomerase n=1 Tax=Campylobacter sp. 19-13652 TaxID=2840180 RepID=UPI003905ABE1